MFELNEHVFRRDLDVVGNVIRIEESGRVVALPGDGWNLNLLAVAVHPREFRQLESQAYHVVSAITSDRHIDDVRHEQHHPVVGANVGLILQDIDTMALQA